MNSIFKYKKIIGNLIYNFLGYGITSVVLQLIAVPYLARVLNETEYANFILLLSLLQFILQTIASSLNNLRLITNDDNKNQGYAFFVWGSILSGTIITLVIAWIMLPRLKFQDGLLIICTSVLWILGEYGIVEFREQLNYRKVLLYNCYESIGYFCGIAFFLLTQNPIYILSFEKFFGFIYVLKNTSIYREYIQIVPKTRQLASQYMFLLMTNYLNSGLGYIDKILIYPMVGAKATAVYSTATIYNKLVSLLVSPVNNIILSYISKMKKKSVKQFDTVLVIGFIVSVIGYCICILFSKTILGILYPTYVMEAMPYMKITCATAMIIFLNGMISPYILKYCSLSVQTIINMICILIYIVGVILLNDLWKIYAVCSMILFSNLCKTVLYIILYKKTINN